MLSNKQFSQLRDVGSICRSPPPENHKCLQVFLEILKQCPFVAGTFSFHVRIYDIQNVFNDLWWKLNHEFAAPKC